MPHLPTGHQGKTLQSTPSKSWPHSCFSDWTPCCALSSRVQCQPGSQRVPEFVCQQSHSSYQSLLSASHFTQKKSQILSTVYKVLSDLLILPLIPLQPRVLLLPTCSLPILGFLELSRRAPISWSLHLPHLYLEHLLKGLHTSVKSFPKCHL